MDAKEIKAIRTAAGLTQVQFAREIGADAITVSRWERGVRLPLAIFASAIRQKFPASKKARKPAA